MGKGLKPVMRWLLGKPKSKQPKPESTQIESDSSDNDEPQLHEEEESDTEPPSPVSQQSIEAVADDSEEERPMYPPPYNPCNNPSFCYVPPTNAIAISEYQPYPDSYPNAYAYAYAYQSYSSENYEEQLAEGIFGVNLDSSNAHYRGDQNESASDDFAQSVTDQAFCYDENYYPY
uniref:Uncharacterized protein n=1 Tax=Fagus sylvatica TaxID=28930 RepID=A0A2N9HQ70_FAGSY